MNIFYQILKSESESIKLKHIGLVVTFGISIAILTSIMGSGIYLPLWVTVLAACFSGKEYLVKKYSFNIKKKTYMASWYVKWYRWKNRTR